MVDFVINEVYSKRILFYNIFFRRHDLISYHKSVPLGFSFVCIFATQNLIQFPLAPMGVLAPRLRTLDVSARPPIDTSGKFTAVHVCRVTFKHLRSHIRSFGTLRTTFQNTLPVRPNMS